MSNDAGREKINLLLHSCCGPCSSSVIERLIAEYKITVYFYNPNITDEDEYQLRLGGQIKLLEAMQNDYDAKINFIAGSFNPDSFYKIALPYEEEKEGGKRCVQCYNLRLAESAKKARKLGIENFTTTLSVSPHKSFFEIKRAGEIVSRGREVYFLPFDFKKKDGFKRSIELSKRYGLYRQNYCGCSFSKR